MTPEQILADLRSDRVKKVIMDGDFCAEIDDQYTLLYALGIDKLDILAVNATAYYDESEGRATEEVMLKSYDEILRVYDALGITTEDIPAFTGARTQITFNEDFAPSDSPAARNIIETAKKLDEPLYVITTGPCSNAVSACLIDPSIKDKIVVVWLGGKCILEENKPFHEWNMFSDFRASQYLLNLDIPLVMLPCGPFGSEKIIMTKADLDSVEGDGKLAKFIKLDLPLGVYSEERFYNPEWIKVMCDYMGVAALSVPDSIEFDIIPAPSMCDDYKYAIDSTRRKIVYGVRPNSDMIIADATAALKKVVAKYDK